MKLCSTFTLVRLVLVRKSVPELLAPPSVVTPKSIEPAAAKVEPYSGMAPSEMPPKKECSRSNAICAVVSCGLIATAISKTNQMADSWRVMFTRIFMALPSYYFLDPSLRLEHFPFLTDNSHLVS